MNIIIQLYICNTQETITTAIIDNTAIKAYYNNYMYMYMYNEAHVLTLVCISYWQTFEKEIKIALVGSMHTQ